MSINMDLAKEFKKILQEYGHDVLVIRQEGKLHCPNCYDEVTQEASRDCPVCLGIGYSFVAERHRTRAEESDVPRSLVRLIKNASIGDTVIDGIKYYFPPEMKAKEQDLIIEVDWDKYGRPIYNGQGIYNINFIDNNQKLGAGKQIYKIAYTSGQPVRNKLRGIRFSELNGIKQYNILLEE
ncbi:MULTISPECIES: hypothetical protein [Bacillus subtilis group]|uniref:hypothetical protein n=1 Tax=Bacillus subtilis group TaxID=653685 RepID=UPI0021DAB34B|nr:MULTISPECIES: hypothetical protein [Bacillus subtilis group]MCY9308714.1 hypothetical protein [Bacillus inaquosorum]